MVSFVIFSCSTKIQTGTYGRKALREIPKPGRKGRKKKKSQGQTQGQLYEKRGQRPPMEQVPEEPGMEKSQNPYSQPMYKGAAAQPGRGYTAPGYPGYEMSEMHQGQQKGFIPVDRKIDPGRYGYRGPQGMHLQHGGNGESEL